jgi:hypothetical protein
MLNAIWDKVIVVNPRLKFIITKKTSKDIPITTSGMTIGIYITVSEALYKGNLYRYIAKAAIVPITVATNVEIIAMSSVFLVAKRIWASLNNTLYQFRVKPSQWIFSFWLLNENIININMGA